MFIPIILYGVFDKNFDIDKLLFSPLLYKTGLDNFYFNYKTFLWVIGLGTVLSFYICLTSLAFFDWGNYKDGKFFGFWNFGNMVYMCVVIVCNFKVISLSNSYSLLNIIIIFLCIGLYFLSWFLFNLIERNELYNTFKEITNSE